MEKEALKQELRQYCGFKIGDDNFAISVLQVQEVIRPYQLTKIPRAPANITGLINLRGQIMTAISLRNIFKLEERATDQFMNIVIQSGEDLYAIEVDEILDVIEVSSVDYEVTPENLDEGIRLYISGVYKLPEKLLMILDLEKLLEQKEV
jgi:purine-binding chemotaxis protein CheW